MKPGLPRLAFLGLLTSLAVVAVVTVAPRRACAQTTCANTSCGSSTSVTYNGTSLTLYGSTQTGSVRTEIWYLQNPTSGTHSVVVTAPNATDVAATSISYTGVSAMSPFAGAVSPTTATGAASAPTAAVTTVIGDPVVDFVGEIGTATPTVTGSTQTLRNTNTTPVTGLYIGNSSSFGTSATGAPVTSSWASTTGDWAIAALRVQAATAVTGLDVGSFTATWKDNGTLVAWRSGYQPDTIGYSVYRSNGGGARTLLDPNLVEGGALVGSLSMFSWTDTTPGWNGDVSYWLKEVRTDGSSTWYGPASPVAPLPTAPTTPALDAGGAGGMSGEVADGGTDGALAVGAFGGAMGAPASPGEVVTTEPQGGCTIAPTRDSLGLARLFLLAGVVFSSARRRRRRWVLPVVLLALFGASLLTPRPVAAAGGVTLDATATAKGGNGLTFSHTMGSAANGLLIVGVVMPITCANTTNDGANCGACGTTCGLDTSTLSSGLLDLWHFDEGSGTTTADSSGNGNPATLVNGPAWVNGYAGKAIEGVGGTSYVQGTIGSWFANNNPLSAAAWVYVTPTTNGPVFGVTAVSGGGGWNMPFLSVKGGSASSTAYGYVWNNTPLAVTVTNNAWHLLVLTYDSTTSTTKFYVDNAAAVTGSGTFSPASVQGYSSVYWSTVIPGARPGTPMVNTNLTGIIDEVRAYNRVLSSTEVSTLYSARLACSGSTCAACGGGNTNCSGSCVATASDVNNCGTCGHTCNTTNGETCTSSSCVCSNGAFSDCSTYCVDETSDSNNCNGCGNTCSSATPTFVDSGLLGNWHLNEGTGTTSADSSGNSHTATLTNSPTWTPGYEGKGLTFDGSTNYLNATIGGTFGTNAALTASAWVYATSTTNGPVFGVTASPPGSGWNMPFLSINGSTVYGWVWYGAGGGSAMSYSGIALNTWHHLAVTYDPTGSGTQKFYVDATLRGTTTGQYNPSGSTDTLSTFLTGAKPSGGGVNNYLKGTIDELRAYNRALSAAEIAVIYNSRQACTASACTGCNAGETSCSGVCTNTQVDPNNCGPCGTVCNTANGQICNAGTCACPTGQTSCGGVCKDLTSDNSNCGVCGTTCNTSGGEACISSACGCASGTDCSGTCYDTTSNSSNCGMCGMACSPITCTTCSQDLVGLWHLDEGTGSTSADSSGSNHTAMLVNSPTWTTGEAGDALTFNGTNNYVDASLGSVFANNSKLSATAWVYATSTTKGPIFGVSSTAGGGGWNMPFLSINGSTVYGWLWQVNGNNPLSATVTLNAWHFLAITYDPTSTGTETFYVDGALAATGTGQFSPATTQNPSFTTVYWETVIPGAMPSAIVNQHYLNGTIDEIRAYSHVLSAGEVKLLYDAKQTCTSSACSGCPTGTTMCSAACTNTLVDKNNCGGCAGSGGTVCSGGTPSCVSGTCM